VPAFDAVSADGETSPAFPLVLAALLGLALRQLFGRTQDPCSRTGFLDLEGSTT
jgi:hypothetical protein